jgi:hypothetical protein
MHTCIHTKHTATTHTWEAASQYMSATQRHKQQYTGTRTRSGRRLAVRMHAVMQIYNPVRKHSYLLIRHMHMCSTSHMRTQCEMRATIYQHTSRYICAYMPTCIHAYMHTHVCTYKPCRTSQQKRNQLLPYIHQRCIQTHACTDTHRHILCQDDILDKHTHVYVCMWILCLRMFWHVRVTHARTHTYVCVQQMNTNEQNKTYTHTHTNQCIPTVLTCMHARRHHEVVRTCHQ